MKNLYLRSLAALCCAALGSWFGPAATAQSLNQSAPYFRDEAAPTASRSALGAALRHSRPLALDAAGLRAVLATAPPEARTGAAPLTLALPLPDGTTGRFAVVATDVMAPALAAQFPQIRTYRGVGVDDPTATVRLDMTPQGFHAQILSLATGTIYLDPATRGDQQHVLSFYRRDMNRAAAGGVPACQFQPTAAEAAASKQRAAAGPAQRSLISAGNNLRTYRLAVAATGEYTQFQGGTVALGLAAVVTTVNRVVGVYEKELAVRMQLVSANNTIIYTNGGTDPYSNFSPSNLLTENQSNIDAVIGAAAYDIGHVFGTGGGGLAGLGVVCQANNKARGETGSGSPVGDAFDIDYVAHEMGHQFGGNHTFNSPNGFCGGNTNPSTAFEPGSGSTIMAYAGICDPDNLQSNSDAYFHSGSFQEIQTYLATTSCAALTATGNTAPVVSIPAVRMLPIGTPFRLTASATDAQNDVLTYCWEQMNTGTSSALTAAQSANNNVPLFRSFLPSSSPTRYFPRLTDVINNTSSPAERLPTVTRTLTFRCTARDQRNGAAGVVGGVDYSSNLALTLTSAAGPFLVTEPNVNRLWAGGSTQTVTWNKSGTDTNGVNCTTVNILLSTDGGLTYPITLASGVPNDNSQPVVLPNISTTTARVMVEAVGNYFYDISNTNFTITAVVTAAPVLLTPATGSLTSNNRPPITGTAVASSTVTVYVDGTSIGMVTADASGNWSLTPTANLADGARAVYATATVGGIVSANSNTNTFTIDTGRPGVVISSLAGANGSTTGTSPIPFTVTFSENVTGFVAGKVTVTNGMLTGFVGVSGSSTYTFSVTPTTPGTATTVNVPANAAQDAAANLNTAAASAYALTFVAPTIVVGPAALPNGTVGTAYNQTITASGGTASYSFAVTTGALPTGLTLASGGGLSGTPTANGTFNFTVTSTDASPVPGPYSGSRAYLVTIAGQPVTAAPVVTTPANGSLTNDNTPDYTGTAVAGSTVTVYVDGSSIGTAMATGGNFSLTQPSALAQSSHTVRATAQASGQAVSASSATNNFTVDTTNPTVTITSTASSPTSTSPIPVTVTFSEPVTSFVAGALVVSGGTVSGFSGSGATYSLDVTPTSAGSVTVDLAANQAQDAAGNGNSAATQFGIVYAAPITQAVWNGSTSTDWFTATNWMPNQVPTGALDALVPAGAPRYPLIAAGNAAVKTLTLALGASLTHTGGRLDVSADWLNNGVYTGFNATTGGTVQLSGITAHALGGSSPTRFYNLFVGTGGATQAVAVEIMSVLALADNLTTNGNALTLLSSSRGDALVSNISGVVVGTATVQRSIDPSLNPGPGYRHYSSPVQSTTVADLATSSFTPMANPAYNTSATPSLVQPFPTVYGYDQARLTVTSNYAPFDKGFFSPAALSNPLTVGRGYTVNVDATQLVDFTGTLNDGPVALSLASNRSTYADGGWHLVGNPYPAPLNYSLIDPVDRAGLEGSIYVYSSTSQYGGQYRAFINGIGDNPVVPVGQGFFARVAAGQASGSLTFRNTHRLTVPSATTFQRTTAETRPLVQLTLRGVAAGTASDDAYVYFEAGATAGVDAQFDAVKLPNSTGLNLASFAAGQQLAINGLPTGSATAVTVPLFIGLPATGTYTLTAAQVLNFAAGSQPFLRDLQLGTLTDLSVTPTYTFTMNAANTTPRFELVFGPQAVLGTASAALAAQVAVFPNPATKSVFVELPATMGRKAVAAGLVDALGRTVLTQVLPAGVATHALPLTGLATGVYSLRLQTEAGVVVKKLVVE